MCHEVASSIRSCIECRKEGKRATQSHFMSLALYGKRNCRRKHSNTIAMESSVRNLTRFETVCRALTGTQCGRSTNSSGLSSTAQKRGPRLWIPYIQGTRHSGATGMSVMTTVIRTSLSTRQCRNQTHADDNAVKNIAELYLL